MARAVERGLRHEGYVVDVAGDGDEALFRASEDEFDLAVLDAMVPGIDGFEVCRELRLRGRWVPVLMLTARDAVQDRVRGLDVGADDYLVKPFAFGELLARIRALLRRAPVERPSVLTCGAVRMDPATHDVTLAGAAMGLSAREFSLLEFLLRHKGEVMSRTAILDHVWHEAYAGLSNVVDVYVGYLRKKLGAGVGAPVIRSVRGVGYVLEQP